MSLRETTKNCQKVQHRVRFCTILHSCKFNQLHRNVQTCTIQPNSSQAHVSYTVPCQLVAVVHSRHNTVHSTSAVIIARALQLKHCKSHVWAARVDPRQRSQQAPNVHAITHQRLHRCCLRFSRETILILITPAILCCIFAVCLS